MARSNPRIFFGVHSFTPYNRTTGLPYGTVEVLKGSSFESSSDNIRRTFANISCLLLIENLNSELQKTLSDIIKIFCQIIINFNF